MAARSLAGNGHPTENGIWRALWRQGALILARLGRWRSAGGADGVERLELGFDELVDPFPAGRTELVGRHVRRSRRRAAQVVVPLAVLERVPLQFVVLQAGVREAHELLLCTGREVVEVPLGQA